MRLRRALRLPDAPCLCLTGAGGKTSALFTLAREYPAALATATTHLGAWQLPWADRWLVTRTEEEVRALEAAAHSGVTLLLGGPPGADGRAPGVSPAVLKALRALAERRSLPLLVEADGARQRPLKAPALHEPALPPSVFPPSGGGDALHCLVVAGLSALGRPLDERSVHRPERFSRLSGLPPGAPLTVEALAAVLRHPQGGLKGLPAGARRVALLTQADTPEQQAAAGRLAERLLGAFHAAVLTACRGPSRPCGLRAQAVFEPLAVVILAAGGSRRMGRPKPLLTWRGQPFVRRVAETALRAGLAPLVVTGAQAGRVAAALEGLPVRLVQNAAWRQGQGASVATGAAALPPETGAAIFLLADQPQVPAALLRALRSEHSRTLSPLIAPLVDGRRATPVLFDRVTFPALRALRGAQGGRALFSRFRLHYLPWHDRALLLDVDTPADYRRLLALDEPPSA